MKALVHVTLKPDVLDPQGPGGVRPCATSCPILQARSGGSARATEHLLLAGGRRRTVVITAAAPACSACTLSSTVSRVESAPVPATTGTRPAAASTRRSLPSPRDNRLPFTT